MSFLERKNIIRRLHKLDYNLDRATISELGLSVKVLQSKNTLR